MASNILKYLLGDRIYVRSAGVKAGEVDHFAISVMSEIGIDLSQYHPKTFQDLVDTSFDLVISLTPEAHHKAMELTRTMAVDVEYWPTLDPSLISGSREQVLAAYRECRNILLQKIVKRFGVKNPPKV